MLSTQLHEEEHTQFRKQMSYLTEKKPTEDFDKRGTQLIPKQCIPVGDRRLEQNDSRMWLEYNRAPQKEEKKKWICSQQVE